MSRYRKTRSSVSRFHNIVTLATFDMREIYIEDEPAKDAIVYVYEVLLSSYNAFGFDFVIFKEISCSFVHHFCYTTRVVVPK